MIQELGFQLVNRPRVVAGVSADRWYVETAKGEMFPANERELALWNHATTLAGKAAAILKTAGETEVACATEKAELQQVIGSHEATIRELRTKVASLEQQLEARRSQQGGGKRQ